MPLETKEPKYVKKANQWVVTILDRHAKGGAKTEQHWFGTLDEANEFSRNWEAPKDDDSGSKD